jgi:flagellar hook assembly protein FlgD
VSVAAPGVGIYSTVPPAGSQLWTAGQSRTGYASGDGTSFSTPLVAGEAALLKAQNPDITVAQLRHAITASAHGYGGLGLGTGQVDFARGLRHVPPASRPSAPSASPRPGALRVRATSTAPRVAFRWDDQPRHRSVAVTAGAAADTVVTWGMADGTHTLRAYDCTAYDECSYRGRSVAVVLAGPAPTVNAAPTLTGLAPVLVTNPAGGPVRLLVDGRLRGVLDRAPYDFRLDTSALTDGRHVVTAQGCSADHRTCRAPMSAPVTVTTRGLHPRIAGLTPSHISPNGDRVRDAATLTFTLPDREAVTVRVLDRHGTVVGNSRLGTLAAGRHTWTWRGRSAGRPLPDRAYTVVLDTAQGDRRGWVSHPAAVDTHRPALSAPTGRNARVYPYPDGYRDRFTARTRIGEPATLTLTVRSAGGRTVRAVRVRSGGGATAVTWNGRDRHGHRVAPGRYSWQLTAVDAAGNRRRSGTFHLHVSAARLRQVTEHVVEPAARFLHAGGTAPCAYARPRESAFGGGLHLVNGCPARSFDLAFADYAFRLPAAVRYGDVALQVRGLVRTPPSEVTAAYDRTDGSTEIPRYVRLGRAQVRWATVGSVPASGHLFAGHRLHISLLLDSYYAGRNDLDAAQVRVRVRMTVLR